MKATIEHNEAEDLDSADVLHSVTTAEAPHEPDSQDFLEETAQSRLFHVFHTRNHRDLIVTTEDNKQQVFFVKNSTYTPKQPDVTLHMGNDQHAPIAAICKFINFSGDIKIGLGDPDDHQGAVWEDLQKKTWNHSEYSWEMNIGHERRVFTWKRTHHVGVDDGKPSLTNRNFKLHDPRTDELLAVYANAGLMSLRKCGKFQINVDYGKDFDTMVILTALALLEKQRRRSRHSGGGGGGP
jgi:hypothetical protein